MGERRNNCYWGGGGGERLFSVGWGQLSGGQLSGGEYPGGDCPDALIRNDLPGTSPLLQC